MAAMDPQKADLALSGAYLAPQIVLMGNESSEDESELNRDKSQSWTAEGAGRKRRGLFRSLSDRRKNKETISGSETNLTRTNSSSTWSFRALRNSFRRKGKDDDDGRASVEPSPSTPDAPEATEKKKSTLKDFLRSTIRRKKKTTSESQFAPQQALSPTESLSPEPQRSSYFKSKKGKHLWASRYGTDEEDITLTAVEMGAMLPTEREAFKSYALEQLGILLRMTVTEPQLESTSTLAERAVADRNSSTRRSIFRRLSRRGPPPSSMPRSPAASSPSMSSLSPRRASVDGAEVSRVFNRPLHQVLEDDRKLTGDPNLAIPIIARNTIACLQQTGLNSPGIFRVSGASRRIRQLNEAFESGGEPDLTSCSPNDVASVLKFFLRSLPEPLLTHALYPCFLRVGQLQLEEQLLGLRLLCGLLPPANRALLQALLTLLGQIASLADDPEGSLMTSRNLALILTPNLLVAPNDAPLSPHKGVKKQSSLDDSAELALAEGDACDVIELMIDLNEHLFVVPPELRDAVLLHHQLFAPLVVNDVLSSLIEQQRLLFKAAASPPSARKTVPPVAEPSQTPTAAAASSLIMSSNGGASTKTSPSTTDDLVSRSSPQTSVHSSQPIDSPGDKETPPRSPRARSPLVFDRTVAQERPLPVPPPPAGLAPYDTSKASSYSSISERDDDAFADDDFDDEDMQADDYDSGSRASTTHATRASNASSAISDSPLADLTKLWGKRSGQQQPRRIADARGSPTLSRRRVPGHSTDSGADTIPLSAHHASSHEPYSGSSAAAIKRRSISVEPLPPRPALRNRTPSQSSASVVLDPERGPLLVLGNELDVMDSSMV